MTSDNGAMSIRIGFLGAGFIANVHASLLRSCAAVDWAGVYDTDRQRALEDTRRRLSWAQRLLRSMIRASG